MQRIVRVGEPQPQYMAVQRRKKVPQVVLHGLLQLLLVSRMTHAGTCTHAAAVPRMHATSR